MEQIKGQTDPKLLALLRTPLADILSELGHADRHVAGLALEALAFKIMRLLDMTYVATRLRANQTGGAEVDLIFESARLGVFPAGRFSARTRPASRSTTWPRKSA